MKPAVNSSWMRCLILSLSPAQAERTLWGGEAERGIINAVGRELNVVGGADLEEGACFSCMSHQCGKKQSLLKRKLPKGMAVSQTSECSAASGQSIVIKCVWGSCILFTLYFAYFTVKSDLQTDTLALTSTVWMSALRWLLSGDILRSSCSNAAKTTTHVPNLFQKATT